MMKPNARRSLMPVIVLSLVVSAVSALTGCEQTGERFTIERKSVAGLPTVTAAGTSWAEVKVESIDYESRAISLVGQDGKAQMFTVTPEARNFTQIKKGDTVRAEYFTRLSASVRKVSEEPVTVSTDKVSVAGLGEKPGIVCSRKAEIRANVEAINYETRELKLRNAMGEVTTLTANKKLKDLEKVKVGDQVVFDYIEAVALTVK